MDLVSNNLQRLICHKANEPTNLPIGRMELFKNYSYSLRLCTLGKKAYSEAITQKSKYKRAINMIPLPLGIK